jgi:uncharacterized membrane protein YgdD (TMEM256/DUF423 family)
MNYVGISAIFGALGVGLGAFGAHALRDRLPAQLLSAYQTGVLYHLVHAVALLAIALYGRATRSDVSLPAWLLMAGIVLFSGSLYAMALTRISRFAMLTPLGGLCFIAAWISVLVVIGRST